MSMSSPVTCNPSRVVTFQTSGFLNTLEFPSELPTHAVDVLYTVLKLVKVVK